MTNRADDTEKNIDDALELLSVEHQRARELLSALAGSSEHAVRLRERTLGKLVKALRIHLTVEEEVFDPAFLAASSTAEDAVMLEEGRTVHETAKLLFARLERECPTTTEFRAVARVLSDLVERHARNEEDWLFPRARTLLSRAELVALGTRMRLRRELLEAGLDQGWPYGWAGPIRRDLPGSWDTEGMDEPDICS